MDVSRLDDYSGEFDPGFEPQTRVRSNTWPLRPKEFLKPSVTPTDDGSHTPTTISEGDESQDGQTLEQALRDDGKVDPHSLSNSKKGTSRRNAWGNLSYADLITKAIQSSPDQRLTLSQIYDWMVQNVPYFKDKGDSNSSAGWKNSIRHNLSLHSRFMRMQNEGTGKSSWWVINQDAKPGKSPRRRHTMDSKEYSKKRPGRGGKKKLEALKAGSSGTDSDFFPDSPYEQLSPGEFRTRTQSNASSIGGRLSPIPDPDLHDKHVPTETASPIPWSSLDTGNVNVGLSAYTNGGDTYGAEQMGNSFAEVMKLDGAPSYSNQDMLLSSGGTMSANGEFANEWQAGSFEETQFGPLPAPPPYPVRQSPQNGVMITQNEMNVGPTTQNGSSSSSYTLMDISQQNMGQCNNSMYQEPLMGQDPMVSGLQNPNSNQYTSFNNSTSNFNVRVTSSNIFPMEASSQNRMTNNSMLRAALSAAKPQILVTTPQRSGNTTSVVGMQQQQQQQHPPSQYGVSRQGLFQPIQPNFTEGDASLEGLEPDDGLQCDISEVLRQEMLMGGGNLDFSFDQFPPNNNTTASDTQHIAN